MKWIKYKILVGETNVGTEEEPNIELDFLGKSMSYSEANEEIAKQEAYNGEYTIEDDGKPEPETTPTGDPNVWDELDAAYQEGVNSV